MARAEPPDAALVDLGLANGWTSPALVEKLQGMSIASIVVTGQVEDYQAPELILYVLTKPIQGDSLATILRNLSISSAP